MLDKDLISNAPMWRLAFCIEKEMLKVMLYDTLHDNSLIYREIPFDQAASTPLKAIEDAIYENPALLLDFKRTDIVIDTPRRLLIPRGLDTASCRQAAIRQSFPDFDGEIVSCPLTMSDASIVMGLESDLIGFLRRTFNNLHLHHRLAPLCRYFCGKSRLGNTGKMYVNLHETKIDLIAFGHNGLEIANTFTFHSPADALYYILACRSALKTSADNDELFICGDNEAREILTPLLREYIAYVMPVIFPSSMFRAGRDAMRVPFELIVLPICE